MNKTVLITGGAKRVGRVLCDQLAESGYDVALHCNSSIDDARELRAELVDRFGVRCEVYQYDLCDLPNCEKLISDVRRDFDEVDLVINNASIFPRKKFQDTSIEFLQENFNVNAFAPFFIAQSYVKQFAKGHIINIIDSNIEKNGVEFFTYLLSKKSLADITKQTARVIGPDFRMNGIAPGVLMPSKDMDAGDIIEHDKRLPMKHHATPEDIAKTVLQLEENKIVTGEIINIDGGASLLF